MGGNKQLSNEQLIEAIDADNARACEALRSMLSRLPEIERRELWREDGARDTAHWLGMRYGISYWKAERWIAAAHALSALPRLSETFGRGELGIDKVVELVRFATPSTETGLIAWAQVVSCGAIRRRGDLLRRPPEAEAAEVDQTRTLEWWYFDDGRRFGLSGELPAAQGAVVAGALDRLALTLPVMPGEDDPYYASARRADALVALCSARVAVDPDQDRATVVVHVQASTGAAVESGQAFTVARTDHPWAAEIEGGPPIHPATFDRLLCDARIQTVIEDASGALVGLGRASREPSAWMVRQVRYRDRECRFPGCGARGFTHAHHIRWWRDGGRTDLSNLLLICSFHHKLVHEYGWRVTRDADGTVRWFHPDGSRYRSGPSPGEDDQERLAIDAAGSEAFANAS